MPYLVGEKEPLETIGGNISGFSNWYARTAPNVSAGNLGITFNGFANLIEKDFFWRNSVNINLGWVKLDNKDIATDSQRFETASDVFTLSSLYGRNINSKWAVSGMAEYRSTFIDNFNNPGFLDIGLGITWTPISSLVVVMHPANYNIIFSSGESIYSSSTGAKVLATYNTSLSGVKLNSSLSLFQSYKSSNFSNWTWTNSLGYTLWKGIGLGFEFGLRDNRQEALNNALISNSNATMGAIENKLQSYWLFGFNYSL